MEVFLREAEKVNFPFKEILQTNSHMPKKLEHLPGSKSPQGKKKIKQKSVLSFNTSQSFDLDLGNFAVYLELF
jgi:hypothetical protein